MVRGIELFAKQFQAFTDRYVLIGGTACDLILNEAGLFFRATKDLDIVLCLETLDKEFGLAFWNFIMAGGYKIKESAEGKGCFYRFQKPADQAYPFMLELFSRAPDILPPAEGSHLTPISVNDEISSLSAILLNDDYYNWILTGRQKIGGLPIVGPMHLIPLKASAWLDLRDRKEAGHDVDRRTIQKHKNDIFRLFQVIERDPIKNLPQYIVEDMSLFLKHITVEGVDMQMLGFKNLSLNTVIEEFRRIYCG